MAIFENWPVKVAVLLVVVVVAGGAYVVTQAGRHMAIKKQIDNVLTEKYRAPTKDAWKHVYADLGVPYSEERRLTTEEMQKYLDKAWAEGIQSAKPQE